MAANIIKSGKPVVVNDISEAAVTKLKVDCPPNTVNGFDYLNGLNRT